MNRRIKIIKLAEREQQQEGAEARIAPAPASRVAREKMQDAATTVMGWIGELQQQNRDNAGAVHNFNSLFVDAE